MIPPSPIKSTISILNYFSIKNSLDVSASVTWRSLDGSFIDKSNLEFKHYNMLNISPPDSLLEHGGSCEFEAFCQDNLRIPYTAAMVIYESERSIAMTHSYSRSLNAGEFDKSNPYFDGAEGCWTIKDTANITSFAIFHNGPDPNSSNEFILEITNHEGRQISKKLCWPLLNPYETKKIIPKDEFDDFLLFTECRPAAARLIYKASKIFPRMLLGWQNNKCKELQVTHSNFDYSVHCTDTSNSDSYTSIPELLTHRSTIIFYRDHPSSINETQVLNSEHINPLSTLYTVDYKHNLPGTYTIKCRPDSESLPSRIVNAALVNNPLDSLDCECSLGVFNDLYKPKRFHWSIFSTKLFSKIIFTEYLELFADPPPDLRIYFNFYNAQSHKCSEILITIYV